MINIHTKPKSIISLDYWKATIKKVLGKKSGPEMVTENLIAGLTSRGIPFCINPKSNKYAVTLVVSGVNTLKEQIKLKRPNELLVAGPAIVVTPDEEGGVIQDAHIDVIVVPSEWVKNMYRSLSPNISEKIQVWPSGVSIPETQTDGTGPVILYKKNISDDTYKEILLQLNNAGIKYEILEYGKFSQKMYFKKLETAPLVIYLQTTESQGIAQFEAWSYNVPTLILDNQDWYHNGKHWQDAHISSPYLTDSCGSFFNERNILEKINLILKQKLNPRNYILKNFTNEISSSILTEIIDRYAKKNN